MPYGIIKVDTVTFTDGGVDKTVSISGLVQNPTFSGNITVTGTISGNIIRGGTTVSGATVTGTAGQFGTLTGNTAGFTTVTGTTVTGATANFTSGNFTSISGGTHTITSGVFASGTAAAPSITFTGDLDTGIFNSAANQVSITTSGTERLRVDGTGQIEAVSLGSESAPTFSFTTDPNTGIYSPGADQVAISTNGTGRLFINSGGVVDISNTTTDKFTLSHPGFGIGTIGSDSTGSLLFKADEANTQANTLMQFKLDGSERMRLTSTGLGVGTSTPSQTLHVNGSGTQYIQISSTTNDATTLLGATSSGSFLINQSTTLPTQIWTNGSPRVHISSAGLVGIGTSSPGYNLELAGSNPTFGIRTSLQSASSACTILFRNKDGNGNDYDIGKVVGATVGNGGYGELQFYTAFNNTLSQQAVLTREGRLGIGTQSPSALLEVAGKTIVGSTSSNALEIFSNGDTEIGFSYITKGNIYAKIIGDITQASPLGGELAFQTATGGSLFERARIDSSGRLLVGTSSGSDNSALLKVQGNVGGSTGTGWIDIRRGLSIPGSGSQLGLLTFSDSSGNNYASIDAYVDAAAGTNDYPGRLVFSTTADGASSPTERMRITSDGAALFTKSGTYGNLSSSPSFHSFAVNQTNQWVLGLYQQGSTGGYGVVVSYLNSDPNNASNEPFYFTTSGGTRFNVRSNGGIANYQANNVNLCDEREKKNIVNLDSTWDCLKHWELKKFHYNEDADDADLRYGVIAQQVAQHCPEVISDWVKQKAEDAVLDNAGNVITPAKEEITRMAVKEQQMYWMAIKALQEAQVRIEQLEAKVAALESA